MGTTARLKVQVGAANFDAGFSQPLEAGKEGGTLGAAFTEKGQTDPRGYE